MQDVGAETVSFEGARSEVFNQDVELRNQRFEDFLARLLADVQGDALLVAVGDLPPERFAVLVRGQCAQWIVAIGKFDLDHIGAVIGKQSTRHWRRDQR